MTITDIAKSIKNSLFGDSDKLHKSVKDYELCKSSIDEMHNHYSDVIGTMTDDEVKKAFEDYHFADLYELHQQRIKVEGNLFNEIDTRIEFLEKGKKKYAYKDKMKNSLGKERGEMPQVDSENITDFLLHFKETVGVSKVKKKLSSLKPSQDEINEDKVLHFIAEHKDKKAKVPLTKYIISNDNYILDGHHRWAADLETRGEDETVDCYRINLPAEDLIQQANKLKITKNEDIEDNLVKAFELGLIDKDTFEKARTGVYIDTPENRRLKRVGLKYGSSGKNEPEANKNNSKQDENSKEKPKTEKTTEEYAKESTEEQLQNAAKGGDEELRIAAKKELERRETEHNPDGEKAAEGKDKEVKETDNKKGVIDKKIEDLYDKYKYIIGEQSKEEIFTNEDKLQPLVKEQLEISRYINRTKKFINSDFEKGIKDISNLLGLKSEKEIKDFFGDGNVLGIEVEDNNIQVLTEDAYIDRWFDKKTKTVEMNEFILNPDLDKSKGTGSNIFFNQVNSFKKLGFEKLKTHAAKSNLYNGYYTWARLGYDFEDIKSYDGSKRQFIDLIAGSNDKEIKDVKSLPELMSFKKGRDFWIKNGKEFHGEFDLSNNSQSMFILNTYIKEKKNGKEK
jgi:hypothetical protein